MKLVKASTGVMDKTPEGVATSGRALHDVDTKNS